MWAVAPKEKKLSYMEVYSYLIQNKKYHRDKVLHRNAEMRAYDVVDKLLWYP
jgi:hypothetical protein